MLSVHLVNKGEDTPLRTHPCNAVKRSHKGLVRSCSQGCRIHCVRGFFLKKLSRVGCGAPITVLSRLAPAGAAAL